MTEADRYISANSLSRAWLQAVAHLQSTPGRKAVHLMLRIADPSVDESEIHAAAQQLIDTFNAGKPESKHKPDIDTTRNTMFPASWAFRNPEPADLAAYYRDRYQRLRSHPGNSFGTYFGRMVAYPRESKHDHGGDQLTELVRKVRQEVKARGPKSSRYEINIFSERYDTNTMSFPCMAHLSFHLHNRALHQQAIYRNEYLVGRAYGNYLGLAQLQRYLAVACGLDIGEFAVTVGHVELDAPRPVVAAMLASLAHLL
jgi:thymidylate synthase